VVEPLRDDALARVELAEDVLLHERIVVVRRAGVRPSSQASREPISPAVWLRSPLVRASKSTTRFALLRGAGPG
jgi:hypothetical protein